MNKDTKNLAGVEHREWHNLYGMYMHRATAEGLVQRNPEQDKPATPCDRACNPMRSSLQPHAIEPATPCHGACNPMSWSLQPHVMEPATPWHGACNPTCTPEQDKRPFVLSRAFYAGSQRWDPIGLQAPSHRATGSIT